MAYIEMFPEAFIELQREIINHWPVLHERLAQQHDTDPELQFAKCLAVICAECNIALDDTYTPDMLIKIVDMCITRLKEKRSTIVVSW